MQRIAFLESLFLSAPNNYWQGRGSCRWETVRGWNESATSWTHITEYVGSGDTVFQAETFNIPGELNDEGSGKERKRERGNEK